MFSFRRLNGMRLLRLTALFAVMSLLAPFASAVLSVVPAQGCQMACCKRSAAKSSCHRTQHSHHDSGPQMTSVVRCGDCCALQPGVATTPVPFPPAMVTVAPRMAVERTSVARPQPKSLSPVSFTLFQRPPPAC